jgi:hypothetical protein
MMMERIFACATKITVLEYLSQLMPPMELNQTKCRQSCPWCANGLFALGWVAATHWETVVAKAASHHGWGKNPGWN